MYIFITFSKETILTFLYFSFIKIHFCNLFRRLFIIISKLFSKYFIRLADRFSWFILYKFIRESDQNAEQVEFSIIIPWTLINGDNVKKVHSAYFWAILILFPAVSRLETDRLYGEIENCVLRQYYISSQC